MTKKFMVVTNRGKEELNVVVTDEDTNVNISMNQNGVHRNVVHIECFSGVDADTNEEVLNLHIKLQDGSKKNIVLKDGEFKVY